MSNKILGETLLMFPSQDQPWRRRGDYILIGVWNPQRMNLNELKSLPFSNAIGWPGCGDIEFQNDEFKSDKTSFLTFYWRRAVHSDRGADFNLNNLEQIFFVWK